jgi:predicted porin
MVDRKASRQLVAPLAGICVLAGFSGQSVADDASSQALRDQVQALQKQVDALSSKAGMPSGQSASPDRSNIQLNPSPNTGVSKEQAGEPKPNLSGPPPITWNGITIYGTVDVGVAYLSHGAPLSQTFGPSLPFTVTNYSNHPLTSLSNSGLSQSKLGLSGVEPLGFLDLNGVFKLETGFSPTSGRLVDGQQSLVDANGLANGKKVSNGDSSRAGQPFQGAAFAGVSSKTFGTLTFGRQTNPMADDLLKYDPQLQAQAFSPISFSGVSAGFGDTENRVLDDSLKYTGSYGPARVAISYQFGSRGNIPTGAEFIDVGADYAGLSVDAVLGKVKDAVAAASLTAAQNLLAPGTLAATVSDNTGYAIMANYTLNPLKFFAGYEHMKFDNPEDPLPVGTVNIGNYVLSVVNNKAFNINKTLGYDWVGTRYSVSPNLDLSIAYYHFLQNSFNANHCTNTSAASCSGTLNDASFVADYRFTRRFDAYFGVNYSSASNGLASGFLFNTDWAPELGVRFNF